MRYLLPVLWLSSCVDPEVSPVESELVQPPAISLMGVLEEAHP